MPGAADPNVIVLRQGGGLRRHLTLSTVTAAFASVCDGELTARAAAAAIAGLLDLDGAAVREEVVAFLARRGQGRPAALSPEPARGDRETLVSECSLIIVGPVTPRPRP